MSKTEPDIELVKGNVKNNFHKKNMYSNKGIQFLDEDGDPAITPKDKKLQKLEEKFVDDYVKAFPIEKLKKIAEDSPKVVSSRYTRSSDNSSKNYVNLLAKNAIIKDENGKRILIDNQKELKKIQKNYNNNVSTNEKERNDYQKMKSNMIDEDE